MSRKADGGEGGYLGVGTLGEAPSGMWEPGRATAADGAGDNAWLAA